MSNLEEKPNSSVPQDAEEQQLAIISDNTSEEEPFGFRHWMNRDMIAFLLFGLLTGLPAMVVTTGANAMFSGVTGAFGLCLSCAAAITSFGTPLLLHLIPCNIRVVIAIIGGILTFVICTLGESPAGPAIGTILGGFVYAFGTIFYLAVAAFYSRHTVIAFSIGAGLACIVGPALYIASTQAFDGNWRMALYVSLPFMIIQPIAWWVILSKEGRQAAEELRTTSNTRAYHRANAANVPGSITEAEAGVKTGFGLEYKRFTLFWKTILPQYVLPLLLCTGGAIFSLFCLAPTFQDLNLFKEAPSGDLNYQVNFLVYGFGQFLFSVFSLFYKLPKIWLWAIVQVVVVVIGIVQLFEPFLTDYGAWMPFMFIAGGIVGGAVSNTNYKIAKDFSEKGAAEEVRSFAMSYGGLGNFGGDAIGGAFAILVQKMAEEHIKVRTW